MSTYTKDLEFLASLADDFFSQRSIRKTLSVINEEEISGWEKWLQVEFASFVHDHQDIKAWGRETPYSTDKRITKARERCAVDFILHQKYKQSHLALELKQIDSIARCTQAMIKDIQKMLTIRQSEFDIRSVWCLGVHIDEGPAKPLMEIKYYAEKLDFDFDEKLFATKSIGKTGYAYTII